MISASTKPYALKRAWRVLVFPGGTEIGLELRKALAWRKEVVLFSAGAAITNHAPFVFSSHFELPMVGHPGWLEGLKKVVETQEITHIFPAHDDALLALAQNAGELKAKVVTSPLKTCEITRSKSATLRHLAEIVPTPTIFLDPTEVTHFPVFLKPDLGQGAQRTASAKDAQELEALLREDPDRIILENLPGREFTIDCFSDRERGLLYARGRDRRRIRHGIAMDSTFVWDERFFAYATRINSVLELHGAWFFQVKEDSEKNLKLMEIAPRIGGTSCLSRVSGVNLSLLSLYEAERIPVEIEETRYSVSLDRALTNRFSHNIIYQTIYIDFDDTLIVKGKVHADLIKLLYQALNRNVRLVLLTRHDGDIHDRLRSHRLDTVFDEIIHLRTGEPKASRIIDLNSIFIDDSHAERMAVFKKVGIPVFDPGSIELLFDERD